MITSKNSWVYFAVSLAVIAACSLLFAMAYPTERGLLWLTLYTIPSHVFVSPFNHEAFLLGVARNHSPISCAVASIIGCLIAGLWDYWLFIPLMHHPKLRAKYVDVTIYKRSVALFRRSPFWAIVVAGLTPLPFYPIKFLSIGDKYPLKRYLLALTVGRTPRYWAIAYLGNKLRLPIWSLVAVAGALLVVTIISSRLDSRKEGKRANAQQEVEPGADTTSPQVSVKSTPSGK